jgi:hypothetical protein
MVEDVAKVVGCLHRGERRAAEDLISDLKSRALYLDEEIQQDVLMFSNQVAFQYDYDPWHKVTLDVTQAADRLIDALVF